MDSNPDLEEARAEEEKHSVEHEHGGGDELRKHSVEHEHGGGDEL